MSDSQVVKGKRGGYRPRKDMSREEFTTIVKGEHNKIREAAAALSSLAGALGGPGTTDFNFPTLDAVKSAQQGLDAVSESLDKVREACKQRAKTKLAEEI